MADIFSKEKRSDVMSRIKPKGTKPELLVFSYLRKNRIHFQRNYRKAHGSPDVALPRKKRAVFIDGDFWHGWKFNAWKDKLSAEYWRPKIEANIRRDKRNFAQLRREGWKVMRVWEHDLVPRRRNATLMRIAAFLLADA